ncbi:MAG: MaoC family dehydratase [Beijerinckiaceae bacterium]
MAMFFEDAVVGSRLDLGTHVFTRESIIHFASHYDPQRFHLSDEGARETHFGKLCASGWHTGAVWMRKMIDTQQRLDAEAAARGETAARGGGSPGFKNLRWLAPVFVDDTIHYFSTLTDKRISASRPEWGLLFHFNEGINQDGKMVFSFEGCAFRERRSR